jgi:hypothetical protein
VCCKACSHALKCSNEGRAPAQSGSQGPSIPPLFLIITRDPMLFDSFVLRHMCFDPGEAALRGVGGVNLTIIAARAPCDASYMPSRLGETCTHNEHLRQHTGCCLVSHAWGLELQAYLLHACARVVAKFCLVPCPLNARPSLQHLFGAAKPWAVVGVVLPAGVCPQDG